MFTIVLLGKVKQCLGLFITQTKFAPRLKRLKLCNFLGRSYFQSVSYLVNTSEGLCWRGYNGIILYL